MERDGDIIRHTPSEQTMFSVPAEVSVHDAMLQADTFKHVAEGLYAQIEENVGDARRSVAETSKDRRIRATNLLHYSRSVAALCTEEYTERFIRSFQSD